MNNEWIDSLRGVSDERKDAMRARATTGSTFALARWFGPAEDASGPSGDFEREYILGQAYAATYVGVADRMVIARTPDGVVMMEPGTVQGCDIVTFDFVRNDRWTRTRFWMNASSVADLGARLRNVPRVPFDSLFIGEEVGFTFHPPVS